MTKIANAVSASVVHSTSIRQRHTARHILRTSMLSSVLPRKWLPLSTAGASVLLTRAKLPSFLRGASNAISLILAGRHWPHEKRARLSLPMRAWIGSSPRSAVVPKRVFRPFRQLLRARATRTAREQRDRMKVPKAPRVPIAGFRNDFPVRAFALSPVAANFRGRDLRGRDVH